MANRVEPTGVLKERQQADGRRQLVLTKKETKALRRQRLCEGAAVLFLDIDHHRTWAEMAQELGISIHALRDLVKTKEFDDAYNLMFPEVGHDPRFQAARGALGDMVPTAIKELKDLLTNGLVSPAVRFKVIEKILELNQVDNKGVQSERFELLEFLKNMGSVNIEQVNIIPSEFVKEYQKLSTKATGETIDAVVKDVTPQPPPPAELMEIVE